MQDERSMREIVETIWNGKWIIIVTTIVTMLISGVLSFLITPTYEAVSTIRLGDTPVEEGVGTQQYISAYSDTVKTDVAINRIIDKLKLDRKVYSINSIRGSVNVEVVNDTNVMKLRVKGDDASNITSIANLLAYELGARIEITGRADNIVKSAKRLKELEDLINISSKELEETNNQLKMNPEKVMIEQSVVVTPYLQSILEQSTGQNNNNQSDFQLQSESINPVYSALKQRIADKNIEMSIYTMERQNITTNISENEAQIAQLETQLDEEKLFSLKSDRMLSEFSAVFISPAIIPADPISPNKLMYITAAIVLGIMLSLIIVFGRHYWQNSSAPKSEGKIISA